VRPCCLWPLLGVAACASFHEAEGDGGADTSPVTPVIDAPLPRRDAGRDATGTEKERDAGHDRSTPSEPDADDAGAATKDAGHDAASDATFDVLYVGDVETVGHPDVLVRLPDAAPDAPKLDACGVCDRDWDCNGFTNVWESTGPESCAEVRNGEAVITLYCENGNTIDSPTAGGSAGIWSVTASGLVLDVNGTEFTCTPAM
jgi:hypothetical protein